MDEAETCDRIAIIDHGRIIAMDTPARLKDAVGGDLITIATADGERAADELRRTYDVTPVVSDGSVSFQVSAGGAFLPGFVRTFGQPLDAINVRRPTLDDVFLELTGREIRDAGDRVAAGGER